MRRGLTLVATAALGAAVLVGVAASAALKKPPHSRQAFAQRLASTQQGRLLSAPARAALHMIATGDRSFRSAAQGGTIADARLAHGTKQMAGTGLANVRVNDPKLDTQTDQTTQDDPSIAVAGKNVVVGFTDSQHVLPSAFTAGFNLNGYAYSSDGGATFKDGGALAAPPGMANVGNPWLASDRSGNVYYASLAYDDFNQNVNVAVAKSTDGGKTFPTRSLASPAGGFFYFADKESIAVGPDPTDTSHDILYATWDDQAVDQDFNQANGLAVSRSTDGGQTWQLNYADQVPVDFDSCSFTQYIGAVIAVAPNGTVYLAAEKAAADDPDCTGGTFTLSEVLFTSNDGGQTFDSGTELAQIGSVNGFIFGPGRVMGDLEFPSIAVAPDGSVTVAWNDSSLTDTEPFTSNIRVATSEDGESWHSSWLTTGTDDSFQPAVSADESGAHVLYYVRNADGTIDVVVADQDGASWTVKRVTSKSFEGALTAPQFDPVISYAYMGQYISNVAAGGKRYYAWADNRDIVKNFMYRAGRNDPNVFLARQ